MRGLIDACEAGFCVIVIFRKVKRMRSKLTRLFQCAVIGLLVTGCIGVKTQTKIYPAISQAVTNIKIEPSDIYDATSSKSVSLEKVVLVDKTQIEQIVVELNRQLSQKWVRLSGKAARGCSISIENNTSVVHQFEASFEKNQMYLETEQFGHTSGYARTDHSNNAKLLRYYCGVSL
jgi:hypothetical protein